DRAARLAIHQRDFTVLVFVVGDDGVEILSRQFLAGLIPNDWSKHIEKLPWVEFESFVAADGSDSGVEIVENDILLRYAVPGSRAMCPRGRVALENAARCGLGTLMIPASTVRFDRSVPTLNLVDWEDRSSA